MAEKVLMKGNEAMAEAAIRSGCRCYFGYPITPQSEVAAYMSKRMPKVGGVYLQAESEVATINMVYGAAAAGVRVMTSSSSPGISLMAEGISYMAGADLPAVIVNIVRGGPGLGGIQPAQSDYNQATRGLAHGDFHVLVLAPNGIQEMCDLVSDAFDLAEKYRMPAMILGDGMLGQMMEPVVLKEDCGTELPEMKWAASGTKNERRHNIVNSLYIQPEELERLILEREARYDIIRNTETRYDTFMAEDAEILLVSYGASSRIARNAIRAARAQGIKAGLFRPITLWPFPSKALNECAQTAKALLSVEMSTGQMVDDIKLAINCSRPVHLAAHTGGMVITPDEILAKIISIKEAL